MLCSGPRDPEKKTVEECAIVNITVVETNEVNRSIQSWEEGRTGAALSPYKNRLPPSPNSKREP